MNSATNPRNQGMVCVAQNNYSTLLFHDLARAASSHPDVLTVYIRERRRRARPECYNEISISIGIAEGHT